MIWNCNYNDLVFAQPRFDVSTSKRFAICGLSQNSRTCTTNKLYNQFGHCKRNELLVVMNPLIWTFMKSMPHSPQMYGLVPSCFITWSRSWLGYVYAFPQTLQTSAAASLCSALLCFRSFSTTSNVAPQSSHVCSMLAYANKKICLKYVSTGCEEI